ncbi:MAG: type II toxin-antitoxin system VapC family toxin [Vicinamibacterales bacterium]
MSSTLIDSNVLIDLFDEDSEWRDWSDAMIYAARKRGDVVINTLIFAEVSAGYDSFEEVDALLAVPFFRREPLPWDAAFLAGRAFWLYRQRGGTRTSPLPDFYIGAHAAVAGHTLLTRDARRYRHYFPKLRIVAP